MKKAIKSIISLPIETPQDEMQKALQKVYLKYGIETVMDSLFKWELKTGYITNKKMKSNLKLKFHDKEYNISFRIQVNIARTKYSDTLNRSNKQNKPKKSGLHCPICIENIGIPGKEHLRAFIFPLDGKKRQFFLHAALFPYFYNHFILVYYKKKPQKIDLSTLEDLFNFTDLAPNYTCCSNSDLQLTGASILNHMHYQVFEKLHLPVMDAGEIKEFSCMKDNVKIILLNYPCGVLKLKSRVRKNIIQRMHRIIISWKKIDSNKNTVNLIVKKSNRGVYESYMFLRNSDHRTPKNLQKIKKEGVGIIEMAGEAILPAPKGPPIEQEKLWKLINKDGLNIVKKIIKGNNPIKDPKFWREFLNP